MHDDGTTIIDYHKFNVSELLLAFALICIFGSVEVSVPAIASAITYIAAKA